MNTVKIKTLVRTPAALSDRIVEQCGWYGMNAYRSKTGAEFDEITIDSEMELGTPDLLGFLTTLSLLAMAKSDDEAG